MFWIGTLNDRDDLFYIAGLLTLQHNFFTFRRLNWFDKRKNQEGGGLKIISNYENIKIIVNKNNRLTGKSWSGDQNQQYSFSSFSYSCSRNSYYLIFRLFEANLALALQFISRIQRDNVLWQINHVFDGESVVGKIQGLFCRKISLF